MLNTKIYLKEENINYAFNIQIIRRNISRNLIKKIETSRLAKEVTILVQSLYFLQITTDCIS